MTRKQFRAFQHNLNAFTEKYVDVPKIREDGSPGPHTRDRLRHVLYWLGYGDNRKDATVEGTYGNLAKRALLVRRLRHPHSRLFSTKEMLEAGAGRRKAQRKHAKEIRDKGPAHVNGVAVQPWFVPWIDKIRKAGWGGWVVSGIRTAAYSVHLCRGICGADRCPGLCAGTASRHNEQLPQDQHPGALDVTEYAEFARLARLVGAPFYNDLPIDRVHFSRDGH